MIWLAPITITDLVNYINNSGVVPNTTAVLQGTQFILRNSATSIVVDTLGTVTTDGITFSNFDTTAGVFERTYLAPGTFGVGGLVVNNVDLAGAVKSLFP